MGAKIKTQTNPASFKQNPQKSLDQNLNPKNPMLNFPAIKISRGTTQPGYAGTMTNLQIVLDTPKNPYLNQANQKNTCQNFPTPKNPKTENLKPQKILRSSLSLEIQSTPPPTPPGLKSHCECQPRSKKNMREGERRDIIDCI